MQPVLEQGSIDKPLTFDVGLIQLSFIPVCSPNTGADLVGGGLWGLKPPPLLGYNLKNDVKSGRST